MYKLIYLARRNPTVSRADWPETWRSHATFANQFAFVANDITYSCYANRIDDPSLDGKPIELPCLSSEHDGVALGVSPTVETLQGGGFSKDERALIDQDELRVFDRYTPEFSFWSKETRFVDGPVGEAAVFRFLRRKEGVSREDYNAFLEGPYGELCKEVAPALGAQRWTMNNTVDGPPVDFPFECIDECWFPSVDAAIEAFGKPEMNRLPEALAEVCDVDKGVTMLTRPTHRWPREPKPG